MTPTVAVFVPALMGVGILVSGALLVADWIDRLLPRSSLRRRRRIAVGVHGVVRGALTAAGRPVDDPAFVRRTLRARWTYLAWSVLGAVSGGFVAWLAFEEYDDPFAYFADNPWLIVGGVAAIVASGALVVLLTVPFLLYTRLPAALREWIASNRLLGRPAAPPPPPGGYVETVTGGRTPEQRRKHTT